MSFGIFNENVQNSHPLFSYHRIIFIFSKKKKTYKIMQNELSSQIYPTITTYKFNKQNSISINKIGYHILHRDMSIYNKILFQIKIIIK